MSNAGTHPANREKQMIVPTGSQDLLLKFFENGYNLEKWDAIPGARRVTTGGPKMWNPSKALMG